MSNYDYQENPQVAFWKEKCKELEEELKVRSNCSGVIQFDDCMNKLALAERKLGEAERTIEKLANQVDELKDDMDTFNALPWYEKIFYRFDC